MSDIETSCEQLRAELRASRAEVERLRDQIAALTERAVFAEAYMRGADQPSEVAK